MALGSTQMTVTTAANFIPELWGPMVIKATEANLTFQKLTWDWSDPVKGKGDTIHAPAVSNVTTNTKSANTAVTLSAPTEAMTNLSINVHNHAAFLLEDIAKIQASFNLVSLYTEKLGYAIAKQLDTDIGANVASFNQAVGDAGVDIGDEQILKIDKFFRADYRGDGRSQILVNGEFGEIYGSRAYVSSNVASSGGERLNTLMHRDAICQAVQLGPQTQGDYILEYLGYLVVTQIIYGDGVARNTFGVWLKS
jgi:hypothetical protein